MWYLSRYKVYCRLITVRWKVSESHISLSSLPSLCQKFSQLVEIWQSLHSFLRRCSSGIIIARVVLFSVVFVCLSVCPEPLEMSWNFHGFIWSNGQTSWKMARYIELWNITVELCVLVTDISFVCKWCWTWINMSVPFHHSLHKDTSDS